MSEEINKPENEENSQNNVPEGGNSNEESVDPEGINAQENDNKEGAESKVDDVKKEEQKEEVKIPLEDYMSMGRDKLVEEAKKLIHGYPVNLIKDHITLISKAFNEKLEVERKGIYEKFISEGGNDEDFLLPNDELEARFKQLNKDYNQLKAEAFKKNEALKNENLRKKYEIIEHIKELTTGEESLNQTYNDFKKLQQQWRETGAVPQAEARKLWETYNHTVELFYDYLKINKEFRDLDFKKNLQAKIELCERAEELIIEKDVVYAYKELQKLHDKYREIGPVPRDNREEVWQRFKDATSKINKKHQEFFVNLKETQKQNVDIKNDIAAKIAEYAEKETQKPRDWQQFSDEVKKLQHQWKDAGSVPKKYNKEVYEIYRKACDTFYQKKRDFFAMNKEIQKNNLQKKFDIINQVETLKDSEDWESATGEIITLQKEWKKIGAVPKGQSEKVWKRFRAACDYFFNRKKEFFGSLDEKYEDNLEKKEAIIKELENFKLSGDNDKDLKGLKDIQKKWADIGFVPKEKKKEIQDKFRDLINGYFDKIDAEEEEVEILKYRTRLNNITAKPKSDRKIDQERDKLLKKLHKLKEELKVEENNIEFFSASGDSNSMLDGFRKKIEEKKTEIELLQDKIDMIDNMKED